MTLRRCSQAHNKQTQTIKIAIVGAGFTGLTAALKLSQSSFDVTVFEKEDRAGGLAGTFKHQSWAWSLEEHYHHWFTNDDQVLTLIKKLGLEKALLFPKSLTSIYSQGNIYPFNSVFHLLSFSPLSLLERLRCGIILLYLKVLPKRAAISLEKYTAFAWLEKWFGKTTFSILWQPLLSGKFSSFAPSVNMAWFWARIKKRTPILGYLEGGYQQVIEKMLENIKKNNGKVLLGTSFDQKNIDQFDKIIFTGPTNAFLEIFHRLPQDYKHKLSQIPHLYALNMVIASKEKFLENTYWLNINDNNFPFIGIIGHTNMIDRKHYGGQHLVYVANYLPDGHPYLKMTKEELFKVYLPYLKKINPYFNYQFSILNFQLFKGSFAQPVFQTNYSKIKPDFKTPLPNVFLANMDLVYPWDRGTNYAIELGEKIAEVIKKQTADN